MDKQLTILDKLKKRMTELSQEATSLVAEKERHIAEIKHIETRLTQIVGALSELDAIIKNETK